MLHEKGTTDRLCFLFMLLKNMYKQGRISKYAYGYISVPFFCGKMLILEHLGWHMMAHAESSAVTN